MSYYELEFNVSPKEPWSAILTAELSDLGCDSFVDTDEGVKAYGEKSNIVLESVHNLTSKFTENATIQLSINEIEDQNWNAVWEADFEPVFVEDKLAILAPFHQIEQNLPLTIIIQPQMSFGTGHHQTTWMMSKMLLDMPSIPSKVLDMGTGTGVLAILAEKLGAHHIDAIDIEKWAYENCIENCQRNNCNAIQVFHGGAELLGRSNYDLILANINKNILLSQIPNYAKILNNNGALLLSGFFESDAQELIDFSSQYNFKYKTQIKKDHWACIQLIKTNEKN